jgi:hypothetical protein
MLKAEIKPGNEYAVREKRVVGAPLERVRIVAHVRGNKWKAEWIEPNPGLVHYVDSGQLVAAWRDRKMFLKEEEHAARLKDQNVRDGYGKDSPVDRAMYCVFENVGDDVQYYNGVLSGSAEALERVRNRARVDVNRQSPYAYVDRAGRVHLPFGDAVALARSICAAEPSTFLMNAEATERKWSREARTPGEEYVVELLNEFGAAWALIRQWAGHEPAVAIREAEIQRLERLVLDAIYALEKAGLERESTRLRRALGRG